MVEKSIYNYSAENGAEYVALENAIFVAMKGEFTLEQIINICNLETLGGIYLQVLETLCEAFDKYTPEDCTHEVMRFRQFFKTMLALQKRED